MKLFQKINFENRGPVRSCVKCNKICRGKKSIGIALQQGVLCSKCLIDEVIAAKQKEAEKKKLEEEKKNEPSNIATSVSEDQGERLSQSP